jgi:hypothetical protein
MATGHLFASLALAATLALILLVGLRELALTVGPRSRRLARILLVGISPLLIVFTATVVKLLADLI